MKALQRLSNRIYEQIDLIKQEDLTEQDKMIALTYVVIRFLKGVEAGSEFKYSKLCREFYGALLLADTPEEESESEEDDEQMITEKGMALANKLADTLMASELGGESIFAAVIYFLGKYLYCVHFCEGNSYSELLNVVTALLKDADPTAFGFSPEDVAEFEAELQTNKQTNSEEEGE